MARTIRCLSCNATLVLPIGPCPLCGGEIEVSVGLTGLSMGLSAGSLVAVSDERPSEDSQRITRTGHGSARSISLREEDRFHSSVDPPADVGKKGESRVIDCLMARLKADGIESIPLTAIDEAGEDGKLQIGDDVIAIQVVTPTPYPQFWNDVSRGQGKVSGSVSDAVAWIEAAISSKAGLYPVSVKTAMLLALDLAHMGVLASTEVADVYLREHGEPASKSGFGSVWLIGPTERNSCRLGSGKW